MTQLRTNEGISTLHPGVETTAAQPLTIAPVVTPLSEVQESDDGESNCIISSQDLSWIEDYALECNAAISPSVTQLHKFREVLIRATISVSKGEAIKLDDLCDLLPRAINRTRRSQAADSQSQAYVFEVLCVFIEFAVATFSTQVGDLSSEAIELKPAIPKLVVALSLALDSQREYYKLRKNWGMREILILPSRLNPVLEAPGFIERDSGGAVIKVSLDVGKYVEGVDGSQCEQELSRSEEACEAHAALVYLSWLLTKTACGSGYEYILKMLSSPRRFTLPSVALLVRLLCQLLRFTTSSNSWTRSILRHVEDSFKANFKDCAKTACSKLFDYLNLTDLYHVIQYKNVGVFSRALNDLHTITRWGISYNGGSSELNDIRDALGGLQEKMWKQIMNPKSTLACDSIGAAIEATLPPASGDDSLFSLKWLEEKNIIWRILTGRYWRQHLPNVEQFLTVLAKKGVVVEEKVFLMRMNYESQILAFAVKPPINSEDRIAIDLIVGAMLDVLDLSASSAKFLDYALKWLETRQADSALTDSRIFSILRKLFTIDKHRMWEKRLYALFRRHAARISSTDLLDCFIKFADHYNTSHVTGPLEDYYLHTSDQQEKLLQDCSCADRMVTGVSAEMAGGALNHTKEFIQKAETWKDKEIGHSSTQFQLPEALTTDFPFTRYEAAKACLDRVALARQLSIGLNPDESNTLATAMSPELKLLEALKEESLLHCKAVGPVEERMRERQLRRYDEIKQMQHQELVKFLEVSRKEEVDVVWEALYQKAKVLAGAKRACIDKDHKDLMPEDILKRVIQNTGSAFKQVEVKLSQAEYERRACLKRLPHVECALCHSNFESLKRKRACLDPCGHASACVDCATQEWKRTKTCALCKTSILKPIAVPAKLFF